MSSSLLLKIFAFLSLAATLNMDFVQDLMGKALKQPVSRLLGGNYRDRMKPYASILFDDPPKLKEGAAAELEGKRVLLIDDVATSATTLELHAKALRAAGAKVNSIVWVYGSTKGTQGR